MGRVIDMFHIQEHVLFSVVDRDTRYVACQFLKGQQSKDVWIALLECWSLRYIGHPHTIRQDRETNFMADNFQVWASEAGIDCRLVPVEAASSMGYRESVHGPLRRIYLKLKNDHPTATNVLLLALAVKGYRFCGTQWAGSSGPGVWIISPSTFERRE
jgi:hypothetical protein